MSFEKFKETYSGVYAKLGYKKFEAMQEDWEKSTGKKVSDVQEDSTEPKKSKRKQDSTASVSE